MLLGNPVQNDGPTTAKLLCYTLKRWGRERTRPETGSIDRHWDALVHAFKWRTNRPFVRCKIILLSFWMIQFGFSENLQSVWGSLPNLFSVLILISQWAINQLRRLLISSGIKFMVLILKVRMSLLFRRLSGSRHVLLKQQMNYGMCEACAPALNHWGNGQSMDSEHQSTLCRKNGGVYCASKVATLRT